MSSTHTAQAIARCYEILQRDQSKFMAVVFLEPNFRVKITAVKVHKKRMAGQYRLTIGRCNYAEREYVSRCRKAGIPFPIRKVWMPK